MPEGSYSGSGTNGYSADSNGRRNGATGPDFFQLDTGVAYRLHLPGSQTLDIFAEAFNLTNRPSFAPPSADRRSTNFLVLTDLRPGAVARTGPIGVRLGF